MVLLWGLPGDSPMGRVRAALRIRATEYTFLDQRDVLSTALELHVGDSLTGRLRVNGRWTDLDDVDAAYLRPYAMDRLPEVARAGPGSAAWNHAYACEQYLWMWAEHADAVVVNRPSSSYSNDSKPYQSAIIRRCGFRVPETLITTDPELAREFISRHRSAVYKSISGVRSIVSRVGPEQTSRLEDVRWCPTQFQEYVPGTDWRVHVVGDEPFCVEIDSDADDYRYGNGGGGRFKMRAAELPQQVADSCRRVTNELGLLVSGIDLRRTPDGDWYCFEVNPSPGFSAFDTDSGAIASAVAGVLARAG
jgi:glutathione synthase/RimK-type ligase-like ATP-grasp enzyme